MIQTAHHAVSALMIIGLIHLSFLPASSHAAPIQNDAIIPLPASVHYQQMMESLSPDRVALGQRLFEDPILSDSGEIACSDCHMADHAFGDGKAFSSDNKGSPLAYNTPSISYAVLNQYFTWTGKFPRIEDHLDQLIESPIILNSTWPEVAARIAANADYPDQFKNAGYEAIDRLSISDAIIQYETHLAQPSRFDYYLMGNKRILSQKEIRGYQLFKDYGCISCHQGSNLGGNLRQKFGIIFPYYPKASTANQRDFGYFNQTQADEDRFFFRVPSLRNVAQTAPYFHDASASTLEEAIKIMFRHQLGLSGIPKDIDDIRAFLNSLDGIKP